MKRTCPICGSEKIIVTVQYRKMPLIRILKIICIIALIATVVFNMAEIIQYNNLDKSSQIATITYIPIDITSPSQNPSGYAGGGNPTGILLGIFLFILLILESVQQWFESKTRIYYACEDCNHSWFQQEELN